MSDENHIEPGEQQPNTTAVGEPASVIPGYVYHETVPNIEGLGAAMDKAYSIASAEMRATIQGVGDPEDGTVVPMVLIKGAALPLDRSIFDQYRARPLRRTGTALFTALDSFIEHTNRFKTPNSALFANDDRHAPSITSVLDYHESVAGQPTGDEALPCFGEHRGFHAFPLSDEWKAWAKYDGLKMSMPEFAAFLEDRITDIVEVPDDISKLPQQLQQMIAATGQTGFAGPTGLFQLATNMKVYENATVEQSQSLTNGTGQVRFKTEHVDANGAALIVPSLFLLAIPVFHNGDVFRIAARLRYSTGGGTIRFWYQMWRTDLVFDTAFQEACAQAARETDLPIFFGTPE